MDFLIMNRDPVVAEWIDNKLNLIKPSLATMYLELTSNVPKWLETRAIDSHRANSRLLKKALRLTERDDIGSVLSVNAVTITDNYWIKPINSDLCYADVRFDNDYFATLALTGSYDSFNRAAHSKSTKTPELTNIGSFEKCWKLINGDWWMYKKANHDEMFSEFFIYDCEDYIQTLETLKDLCPNCICDYVKMLFLDTICENPDRHTFNFGILRDINTGDVLGLAPNFDNNMALISRGYPKNIKRKNDIFVSLFNELLEFDNRLKKYIPPLTEEIILKVIKSVGMRVRSKEITEFIMNGYNQIEQ